MIPTRPVGLVSPSPSVCGGLGASLSPWGLGLVSGVGLGLTLGLGTPALASSLCVGSNGAAQAAVPHLSPSLAQDVCQMVTMPTATRSDGDSFLQQIQPGSLLTDTSASAETMTLPSLWWTRDSLPIQVGRHRLVDAWISYALQGSEMRVVDVMINGQFWRALTMHQRYGVLSQFGNTAQEFGYHLRFFQSNGYSARMIGLYACNTSPGDAKDALASAGSACLVTVEVPRIVDLQRAMQDLAIQTATEPETIPLLLSETIPTASIPQADLPPAITEGPVRP